MTSHANHVSNGGLSHRDAIGFRVREQGEAWVVETVSKDRVGLYSGTEVARYGSEQAAEMAVHAMTEGKE